MLRNSDADVPGPLLSMMPSLLILTRAEIDATTFPHYHWWLKRRVSHLYKARVPSRRSQGPLLLVVQLREAAIQRKAPPWQISCMWRLTETGATHVEGAAVRRARCCLALGCSEYLSRCSCESRTIPPAHLSETL